MQAIRMVAVALGVAVAAAGAGEAVAAAKSPPPMTDEGAVLAAVPVDPRFDTEMVVRDWVLCTTRSVAEELALAGRSGPESAMRTYQHLSGEKLCGRFAELLVVLKAKVAFESVGGGETDAAIFEALVNLSGKWASAFVVSGSLPDH